MPNSDSRDRFFYPTLTLMIDSYNVFQGEGVKSIILDVLVDDIPEINQEYQLKLININTAGKIFFLLRTGSEVIELFLHAHLN